MTSLRGTSSFRRASGPRSGGWWPQAPTIVAETLAAVPLPILTALCSGAPTSASAVARALVASLQPEEAPDAPPAWLREEQRRSFRRLLAAVRRHRGALLADPVGSGKTFVALAVAAALNPRGPTACLVPATLVPQWRSVANGLGVRVLVRSHQQASRGRLPLGTRGLVIVDESHHFRNPQTCRYGHVAPWLIGRPILLVTATPVVNRLEDLAHQLLLGVRDDALLADGVISLGAALGGGQGAAALGRLVVEERSAGGRPARLVRVSPACQRECGAAAQAIGWIDRLSLSCHTPTAALVRGTLARAAASSPAALLGALRRYRRLLLHARDAVRTGRTLSRAELRKFAGDLQDQLVLWELLPESGAGIDLDLADLERTNVVIEAAVAASRGPDAKLERLQSILADGHPTIVFVSRRETVRHLRERLAGPPIAWCTGERAGLGRSTVPRLVVLGWFRTGGSPQIGPEPTCLVVTDVAAEGLDLQRAARVVHYDLPWTPMRLEQREGRAVRLGSVHGEVEVVRFTLPEPLERGLRVGEALTRKATLPIRAGLGPEGRRLWRWQSEIADELHPGPMRFGVALVPEGPSGVLAGFGLYGTVEGHTARLAASVVWIDGSGGSTEAREVVGPRLAAAARSESTRAITAEQLELAMSWLAAPLRQRLGLLGGHRWAAGASSPAVRELAERLHGEVQAAARSRNAVLLAQLERALGFITGGHTAGEALLIQRLIGLSASDLCRRIPGLPAGTARWGAVEARLTGLVVFEEPGRSEGVP
jgi:superfamily II DNA or RNA helicase